MKFITLIYRTTSFIPAEAFLDILPETMRMVIKNIIDCSIKVFYSDCSN